MKVPYFCEYSYLWPYEAYMMRFAIGQADMACSQDLYYPSIFLLIIIYLLVYVVQCGCITCEGGVLGIYTQQAFICLVQSRFLSVVILYFHLSKWDRWLVFTIRKKKMKKVVVVLVKNQDDQPS